MKIRGSRKRKKISGKETFFVLNCLEIISIACSHAKLEDTSLEKVTRRSFDNFFSHTAHQHLLFLHARSNIQFKLLLSNSLRDKKVNFYFCTFFRRGKFVAVKKSGKQKKIK